MTGQEPTTLSPREQAARSEASKLMQRWKQLREQRLDPWRMRDWTLYLGFDESWRADNGAWLAELVQEGLTPTQNEYERWLFQMDGQIAETYRASTLQTTYGGFRGLYDLEFPAREQNEWIQWRPTITEQLLFAGRIIVIGGLVGSGKSGVAIALAEAKNRLKEGQVAEGRLSDLALMLRKRGDGGSPEKGPNEDPNKLGLFDSVDYRAISNYSLFDRELPGGRIVPSGLREKWIRVTSMAQIAYSTGFCGMRGFHSDVVIDESAATFDKYRLGAGTVKTFMEFARHIRKDDHVLFLMTQWVRTDFPQEIRSSYAVFLEMGPPIGDRAPGWAFVTIPSAGIKDMRVSRIPLPVSAYDTQAKVKLAPDVRLQTVNERTAELLAPIERSGRIPSRGLRAAAVVKSVNEYMAMHGQPVPRDPFSFIPGATADDALRMQELVTELERERERLGAPDEGEAMTRAQPSLAGEQGTKT